MIECTCYAQGHGEGVIDAICDDNPSGGVKARSYRIIFGKGHGTYAKWVEAGKVRIIGAVQPKAYVKSSYQEGE